MVYAIYAERIWEHVAQIPGSYRSLAHSPVAISHRHLGSANRSSFPSSGKGKLAWPASGNESFQILFQHPEDKPQRYNTHTLAGPYLREAFEIWPLTPYQNSLSHQHRGLLYQGRLYRQQEG